MIADHMTKAEALDFFTSLFSGKQHIPGDGYGEENLLPCGRGWSVITRHDLATYDAALLTSLVFLAHDHAYRAAVMPKSKDSQQIAIWKRSREGDSGERHPTLDQAIQAHQRRFGPWK